MSNFVNYFSGSIQRQIIYYKNYGFIKFCKHMLSDFIHHHRLVLFQGDIHQNQEDIQPKIPVDFRLISTNEHDISRLVDFWPDTYTPRLGTRQKIKDLINEYLSAGEWCMTAEYEGKIAYMGWFGTKVYLPFTKKRGLRPGEVLCYYVYCSPEMRGNNLMSAMFCQMFKLLKKENYQRFVCYLRLRILFLLESLGDFMVNLPKCCIVGKSLGLTCISYQNYQNLRLERKMKRACVLSNGCQESMIDSARVRLYLQENGWHIVDDPTNADIILFYSCALTNSAVSNSMNRIKEIQKKISDESRLIVWGCLSKIDPESLNQIYNGPTFCESDLYKLDEIINAEKPIDKVTANQVCSNCIKYLGKRTENHRLPI